jgi:hypothetical protein
MSENHTISSTKAPPASDTNPLIDNIKQWVYYDNQLKLLNEKVKDIREKKGKTQETIIENLKSNSMEKTVIGIGDAELKMVSRKEYPPLTYAYVERCLTNVIPNKEHVDYIMHYMKSNREIRECFDLRKMPRKLTP